MLQEPNVMNKSHIIKKAFDKVRLVHAIKEMSDQDHYSIGVHRFSNFTILAKFEFKDQNVLKEFLVKRTNKKLIKNYAFKKVTILQLDSTDLTNEFDELIVKGSQGFANYLTCIEKLYLADNSISDITFLHNVSSLQLLYISTTVLM